MKVVRLTNIPAMFSTTREKIRVLISFNFGTFFFATELSHAKLGET